MSIEGNETRLNSRQKKIQLVHNHVAMLKNAQCYALWPCDVSLLLADYYCLLCCASSHIILITQAHAGNDGYFFLFFFSLLLLMLSLFKGRYDWWVEMCVDNIVIVVAAVVVKKVQFFKTYGNEISVTFVRPPTVIQTCDYYKPKYKIYQ